MKKLISLSAALVSVFTVHVASANSTKLVNPANNHSYQRFDAAKTWAQAKTACATKGAHLATITDQAENDWVWNNFGAAAGDYVGRFKGFFIGGTDAAVEGQWTWVTGEAWGYSNWGYTDSGIPQPDNGDGIQNYNIMWNYKVPGSWDDAFPTDVASYLCEWEQPENIYSQVVSLADVNHNGTADYALLGEKGTNYILFVYDGSNQTLISQTTVKAKTGYAVKSFTVSNDVNGDGVAEIAVLVVKTATNTSTLQLHDPVTGSIVSTLNLPKY
jgi:hypothetical protein